VLRRDADGRVCAGDLAAGSCLALYGSREEALIGDSTGISRMEIGRMMVEESKRLVWQNWLS
jgi:hypothetical protein